MNTYGGRFDSSVEIGHIYAPDTATPFTGNWRKEDLEAEFPIFEPASLYHDRIAGIAASCSDNPIILSLIDDIRCSEYEARFTEYSVIEVLDVDETFYESHYRLPAMGLMRQLHECTLPDGIRFSKDNCKLIVGSGKRRQRIALAGFSDIEDPNYPSCQMLDAAWMLDRLQSVAPKACNVLPIAFRDQQHQVAIIATILPQFHNFEVVSIFVDEQGNEAERFAWPIPARYASS